MKVEVSDLVAKGEELAFQDQYDAARKFFERAVEKDTGKEILDALDGDIKIDAELLESFGVASVNAGDAPLAFKIFLKLVSLYPERDAANWMSLGQLQNGKDAAESYLKGIHLLTKELESELDLDQEDKDFKNAQISSAYCGLTELYMSDLCFEEDAEQKCEEFLAKASAITPDSIEVSQLLCSFLLSKNQRPKAVMHMEKTLRLLSEKTESIINCDDEIPFEFRVNTARLLVELSDFVKAIELLVKLLDENDSIVEPWLLLALSYNEAGEIHAARESCKRGRFLLEQYSSLEGYENSPIFKEQLERLATIESKLPQEGEGESNS